MRHQLNRTEHREQIEKLVEDCSPEKERVDLTLVHLKSLRLNYLGGIIFDLKSEKSREILVVISQSL